ncbi:MAG: segregation/condensation protein A [Desulfococcaceae bacterium]|jgi:segregation and condensation protein A|nr:segregation/condensation protein A [Desulfococcaceae bacterium]
MPDDRYEVKVGDVFEGPMDLLIYLIKKNEVDIYDIPIAMITEQYLNYLQWMKTMNIDVAGDFILMAATLAHIKSRTLLPVYSTDEDEEEDPRMEIARPLLEYLQMKSVAEQLENRPLLGEDTYVRSPGKEELAVDKEEQMITAGLFDLIAAFQAVLEKMGEDHRVDFTEERFSVKDKISELIEILEERGTVTLQELFPVRAVKEELIVTFLSILEMAKLNLIRISQQIHTGIIRLFYI